jgi:hypothetical protein
LLEPARLRAGGGLPGGGFRPTAGGRPSPSHSLNRASSAGRRLS